MSIGENIKKYRKELGYTQAELAEEIRVTEATICRWEKGQREPKISNAARLIDILNIDFENLIE